MGLIGPRFVGGTGALGFLLAAEAVAATAVVSEAVLIYVARIRNLVVSLLTVVLQGLLTVAGILAMQRLGYNELYQAAAAACALALALGFASLVKSRILARILKQGINNWRWALALAVAPALVVGWAATAFLPEWAELIFGIPAILAVYFGVLWVRAFEAEDRVLFQKAKP